MINNNEFMYKLKEIPTRDIHHNHNNNNRLYINKRKEYKRKRIFDKNNHYHNKYNRL